MTASARPLEPLRVGPRPHPGSGRRRAHEVRTGRRRPAVFLDRDGVLNVVAGGGHQALSPRHEGELRIAPGAAEATRRLAKEGFTLIVITNQPDVARGVMTSDTAVAITREVMERLALDDAYVCPHDGSDGCPCRKPRSGMLHQARADWALDFATSWLVGDRWVDVGAAAAAGVRSVLVESPYSWDAAGGAECPVGLVPTLSALDIGAAADAILRPSSRADPRVIPGP